MSQIDEQEHEPQRVIGDGGGHVAVDGLSHRQPGRQSPAAFLAGRHADPGLWLGDLILVIVQCEVIAILKVSWLILRYPTEIIDHVYIDTGSR